MGSHRHPYQHCGRQYAWRNPSSRPTYLRYENRGLEQGYQPEYERNRLSVDCGWRDYGQTEEGRNGEHLVDGRSAGNDQRAWLLCRKGRCDQLHTVDGNGNGAEIRRRHPRELGGTWFLHRRPKPRRALEPRRLAHRTQP